jgi:class 3 adenylate cyclase
MMAALQMVQRTRKILINGQPLEMGIGVHTGLAVVGGVGSKKRLDYTAIGTTVNLAARLCGIARTAEVLVTQDTISKVGPAVIAEANEPVILKGLEAPITPYTLKGFGVPQSQPIRLYNVATQPMGVAVGQQGPRPQSPLDVRSTDPALPKRR